MITNDGELANKLTKAASGVEKTYLVKVAGQPAEEALDRLREGVAIERGRPAKRPTKFAPPPRGFARCAKATIRGTKSSSSRAAIASCAKCSKRSATTSRRFAA